jgi:hypothetical protein
MSADIRQFDTGATRSADSSRYDPEGFLSPLAIERFCEYMNKHRQQPDGSIRASDNWQKGLPLTTYIKGMWRHFLHLWVRHRGFQPTDDKAGANAEEDLCAIIFNAQGYLHELLKANAARQAGTPIPSPLTGEGKHDYCKCGKQLFTGLRPGDLAPSVVAGGKHHTPVACTNV